MDPIQQAQDQLSEILNAINNEKLNQEAIVAETKALVNDLAAKKETITKINDELEILSGKRDMLQTDINGLQSELNDHRSNTDQLKEINKNIDDEIATKKDELEKLNKELEERIAKDSEEYNNKIGDLKKQAEDSLAELMNVDNKKRVTTEEVNALINKKDSMEFELSAIEEKVKNGNKIIEDQEIKIGNNDNKFQLMIDDRQATIDSMAIKIQESTAKIQELETSISTLSEQSKVEQENLNVILTRAGALIQREEYVTDRERYIAEQFSKIGITYQPYA